MPALGEGGRDVGFGTFPVRWEGFMPTLNALAARKLVTLTILALLLSAPARIEASSHLRPELAGVAKRVQKFLEGRGEDAVAVGEFTGPAQLDSNFGAGIQEILAAELQ